MTLGSSIGMSIRMHPNVSGFMLAPSQKILLFLAWMAVNGLFIDLDGQAVEGCPT